jgi:hypothetical protein
VNDGACAAPLAASDPQAFAEPLTELVRTYEWLLAVARQARPWPCSPCCVAQRSNRSRISDPISTSIAQRRPTYAAAGVETQRRACCSRVAFSTDRNLAIRGSANPPGALCPHAAHIRWAGVGGCSHGLVGSGSDIGGGVDEAGGLVWRAGQPGWPRSDAKSPASLSKSGLALFHRHPSRACPIEPPLTHRGSLAQVGRCRTSRPPHAATTLLVDNRQRRACPARRSASRTRASRSLSRVSTATADPQAGVSGRHVLCGGPPRHLTVNVAPPASPTADSSHLRYRHQSLFDTGF